ncbi:MAG: hypothetical protein Q611_LSC00240G0001, partial [Leuconostoc sp. DORA_2]
SAFFMRLYTFLFVFVIIEYGNLFTIIYFNYFEVRRAACYGYIIRVTKLYLMP